MKKILAAIDFSSATQAVVDAVVEFARRFDADIILLHVALPDPEFIGYEPGPVSVRREVAAAFRSEHKRLHELKVGCAWPDAERVTALLVQGPTVEKILSEQQRLNAGLIFVGSHGHGALYHLLLGSVTEGLLKHARCPVVVVPAEPPQVDETK